MLNFTISTSKKASNYLLKNFRRDKSLTTKRNTSKAITTKYDKQSNKIIITEILKKYPKHNILSEESKYINNKSNYTWIIDPLDGTSNFANSNPFFAVSIALVKNNELILGVVNAPYLKELFTAEKGKCSSLNGKRIKVSNINNLSNSYLLGCEGSQKSNKRISKINSILHPIVKDLRKLGSASIEGCWVACGRFDAYIVTKIFSWDIAASALIVKEANGSTTDFKGKEWNLNKSDLVLSNKKIHNKILNYVERL